MLKRKILFIDRDGTLIEEPADQQVDSLAKLKLLPNVISALLELQEAGFRFVMITNQDGLGTSSFPTADFELPQQMLLDILATQGIYFDAIKICPHFLKDNCECRKPKLGMVLEYLRDGLDYERSYVIGDRDTDMQLAQNMGIKGLKIGKLTWPDIASQLTMTMRQAKVKRVTNETQITADINLEWDMALILALIN